MQKCILSVRLFDLCFYEKNDINKINKVINECLKNKIKFENEENNLITFIEACIINKNSLVLRELLTYRFEFNLNLNLKLNNNESYLHFAAMYGNLKILKFILAVFEADDIDILSEDSDGRIFVHLVILSQNFECIKYIFKKYKNLLNTKTDNYIRTPLYYLPNYSIDKLKELFDDNFKLNLNLNLNSKDCQGYNLLKYYEKYERNNCCEIILNKK
jgi:hypothetical protein